VTIFFLLAIVIALVFLCPPRRAMRSDLRTDSPPLDLEGFYALRGGLCVVT